MTSNPTATALRRLTRLVTDKANDESFKVGLEHISSGTGHLIEPSESEFDGAGLSFLPGDILYGKLRPYLAKAWVADRRGAAIGDFLVLRPENHVIPEYLKYCLLSPDATGWISASVYGSRMPRTNWETAGNLQIPLIDTTAQSAVVGFLDRETAEIDAFIADQERLIELLTERKQVSVRQLVNEGVANDDLVALPARPWLGDHPSSWPLAPLRAFLSETNERAGKALATLPLLSVSIHSGVMPRGELTDQLSRAEDLTKYRVCNKGDLVLNRMRAFQGGIGVASIRGLVSPDYMVCRLSEEMMPDYCHHLMRTPDFIAQMTRELRGLGDVGQGNARTPRINPGDFLRCVVAVPPLTEQRLILQAVDNVLSDADDILQSARQAIELSRERRAALISAAVTGQLDVTGGSR